MTENEKVSGQIDQWCRGYYSGVPRNVERKMTVWKPGPGNYSGSCSGKRRILKASNKTLLIKQG
jgi:hypothetical protein